MCLEPGASLDAGQPGLRDGAPLAQGHMAIWESELDSSLEEGAQLTLGLDAGERGRPLG